MSRLPFVQCTASVGRTMYDTVSTPYEQRVAASPGTPASRADGPRQALRRPVGAPRPRPRRRPRHRARPARPQRRRQDHRHPHPHHAAPARPRARATVAGFDVVDQAADGAPPHRRRRRSRPRSTACSTPALNLEMVGRLHQLPEGRGPAAGRRAARAARPRRRRRPPGQDVLRRHAPPARPRRQPRRPTRGAVPRRADHRPRPAQPQRPVGDAPRPRRDGTTIILTTQYLEEADRLADDIVVLDHGRTVATARPPSSRPQIGDDRIDVTVPSPGELVRGRGALAAFAAGEPTHRRRRRSPSPPRSTTARASSTSCARSTRPASTPSTSTAARPRSTTCSSPSPPPDRRTPRSPA